MSEVYAFRSTVTKDRDGAFKIRIPKHLTEKFSKLYRKNVIVVVLTDLGGRYEASRIRDDSGENRISRQEVLS